MVKHAISATDSTIWVAALPARSNLKGTSSPPTTVVDAVEVGAEEESKSEEFTLRELRLSR